MKTFIVLLCALFGAFILSAQEKEALQSANIDEVEISPPHFTGVDNYVAFANSERGFIKNYLVNNINYPKEAADCNRQGTEVLKFIVTEMGEVEQIEIINSVCPAIDKEIIRALKSTNGQWMPGLKDGNREAMPQEISITFSTYGDPVSTRKFFDRKVKKQFAKGTELFFVDHKTRKAYRQFNTAMVYRPYDKSLLFMRGLCSYGLGNTEDARKDWLRYKELTGDDLIPEYFAEEIKQLEGYEEFLSLMNED